MIACHAEGREKQVTTWNPECKKEQGPAPRAALDLWTAGKGSTWGNQITHMSYWDMKTPSRQFHVFRWEDLSAGRWSRHHKEEQRTKSNTIRDKASNHNRNTYTTTQNHTAALLYQACSVFFHICSSVHFCWAHQVEVQLHWTLTFPFPGCFLMAEAH